MGFHSKRRFSEGTLSGQNHGLIRLSLAAERFKCITNTTTAMADVTISVRVDQALHRLMKFHDEVNWSSVIRRSIKEEIEDLESIDYARAREAGKRIDKIRESGAFSGGKPGTEIIRLWRNRRR